MTAVAAPLLDPRPGPPAAGSRTSGAARAVVSPGAWLLAVTGFVLLATRQAFTVPYTGLGLSPAQLVLFVLAAVWVITRVVGQRAPAGLGVLSVVIVVRVACVLISYGLAESRGVTSDVQRSADLTVGTEITAAITVFVLVTLLRTTRDVEWVLRGLVLGGAVSAAFALVQYTTGTDIAGSLRPPGFAVRENVLATALLREGLVRPQGAAAHPLELGAVCAVLVPVGIGLALAARRRGNSGWWWVLAAGVIAAGGAVSLSRSTFVGVGVGLLVMLPRWPLRRVAVAVSGAAAVVVVAALAAGRLADALRTLLLQGSDDLSLQSRSAGRHYVWTHFAEHFWFGQGAGTYDLSTQNILDNQYLSQLMETGVIGMILLIVLLGCAFGYAFRAGARSVRSDRGELASGVAGALAAVLAVSTVLDTGGFVQMFTLIWLLIGLAAALWRLETGGFVVRPGAATAR